MPVLNFRQGARFPIKALAVALTLALASVGRAAAATPATSAGPAVPAGSVVQMLLGLALVLGLVFAVAWFLKRFSGLRSTGSGMIRIIGGAAVGQRERIVLVEVGGTWLLVGVAPGQVRALHSMTKMEAAADIPGTMAQTPAAEPGFATWLRRMAEKRSHE